MGDTTKDESINKKYSFHCSVSLEDSICVRKCFMTGEFCSKQTNIHREMEKLHEKKEINAFVIMNFSDMSDVVYKWRLRNFIESLKKYLYLDTKKQRLYCVDYAHREEKEAQNEHNGPQFEEPQNMERVKEIHVIRSDSEPASNYVVCNRICQQMQIADLIIVDVSSQNPNVFYELGMAIAFGKLILPICYSESYYRMAVPVRLQKLLDEYNNFRDHEKEYARCKELTHHIDCYPWRRSLYEYYGILYKREKNAEDIDRTKYLDYERVKDSKYGFSDIKYSRFPYHQRIGKSQDEKKKEGEKQEKEKIIGEKIYEKLENGYNNADYCDNTLIVYTLESFLNEEQAGRCIVNFYRNIVARMRQEQCFCGERVGVLVQSNIIPENDKDSKKELYLNYNIGEIIHIGVNQATYLAADEKIKAPDVLQCELKRMEEKQPDENKKIEQDLLEDIMRYIKGYIRNKGLIMYPNNPVYVERLKNKLQKDVLKVDLENDNPLYNEKTLVLYHIMLRTLRYTNQVVIDISNNCLQALFWLGAAHGRGINAITVLHEDTEKERKILTGVTEKKARNVFDVAGLWTAVFQSNDTEGFYKQLASVYEGIERHSRLMLPNCKFYEEEILSHLTFNDSDSLNEIIDRKKREEKKVLESYYRNCLLSQMLCYNKLNLYIEEGDLAGKNRQPKGYTSKWDFEAVSALSNYLSKRALIGEYHILSRERDIVKEKNKNANFICIGQDALPENDKIVQKANLCLDEQKFYIKWPPQDKHTEKNKIGEVTHTEDAKFTISYNGFENSKENTDKVIAVQETNAECPYYTKCTRGMRYDHNSYILLKNNLPQECMIGKNFHYQIGQLVLWRDVSVEQDDRMYFQIGLNGSSGPATLALATLFINEEQKEDYLKGEKKKDDLEEKDKKYLLCELQEVVRKKFMEEFKECLEKKLKTTVFEFEKSGISEELKLAYKAHINLIMYTVCNYLSTILYRYFLPFLSNEDIACIYNSMHIFVNSMKAARKSPFSLKYQSWQDKRFESVTDDKKVQNIVDIVPEVLLVMLKSFRGVEAFYEVLVEHTCKKCDETNIQESEVFSKENIIEDIRDVKRIDTLKIENRIRCLFTDYDEAIKAIDQLITKEINGDITY